MAASVKRKQEEKHLQLLREMTSRPANRKCFDCEQRGPTYANMTVGSFVCTTCSGILRGLNPPHRVKSISMTTFTQQEIEFLQKHSNEVCKHIWLGLYDDRSSAVPDFREPQKVKEFLQEKYEKKRWYVPPEQAKMLASVQVPHSGSSASTSSTPEVQPLKTLQLNKTPSSQSPVISRSQLQEKKFDLLSDLGGDIFAAPPSHSAAPTNFANFAHFSKPSAGGVSAPPLPSVSAEDRYAALAELDSALSSTSQGVFDAVPGSAAAPTPPLIPSMQQGFTASTNPFVAAAIPPESMCTNPFQTNSRSSATGGFPVYGQKPPMSYGQPAVSNNPFMGGAPAASVSCLPSFSISGETGEPGNPRAPGGCHGDGGNMAQLLGETLFEISAQGPAPIKDYFCLQVTQTEVIWRWWKISLRPDSRNTRPGEVRESHSEYLDDSRLQSQVLMVFGPRVLQYSKCLCQGQFDYLQRLPDSLLLHITAHLELEDVTRLAHTCHRFKQLYSSEQFWEQTVRLHCDTVTPGMEDLARDVGWRRVFFTNKLQLQKQIRRRRAGNKLTHAGDFPQQRV
ncbi:hypothetical protein PHYPO_G00248890 [Pangasianodon hypophthalmus]|uniref:Arf-GAP domain-containing protein n=2 Tax=Pangasianodon hypophthalmus TaxID=310915 RepID=A0A5N5J6Q3_PANHP|nr:hypothetical protein PHYPO_G00248890 [Pangasianodon hypophthalmus]